MSPEERARGERRPDHWFERQLETNRVHDEALHPPAAPVLTRHVLVYLGDRGEASLARMDRAMRRHRRRRAWRHALPYLAILAAAIASAAAAAAIVLTLEGALQ